MLIPRSQPGPHAQSADQLTGSPSAVSLFINDYAHQQLLQSHRVKLEADSTLRITSLCATLRSVQVKKRRNSSPPRTGRLDVLRERRC